ncbi:MAG: 3-methyl-2-oxobutanoate hydroxymethyltransferase [Gammaproteobacteria bacterium]|jgi:3-methyl-2-oxobutanoate hydroxymethyltransferase
MNQVTVRTLTEMKARGEKIAVLTCYDATFAHVVEAAGVDVILVGDSLGMVMQGKESTLPVTVDEMVYHTACVARARERCLLMADMPFLSYASVDRAIETASALIQQGGAQVVKLEGGGQQLAAVRALTENGVAVCAHLGLQPQSVHKLGGYRVQGRDHHEADEMLRDAINLQQAGAQLLVLECVPQMLAAEITRALEIPVIGIGAGKETDAQVLVLQDVLGITPGQTPKFVRSFMQGANSIQDAISAYVAAVREGSFPAAEQCFT